MRISPVFWLLSLGIHVLLMVLLGTWKPAPDKVLPEVPAARVPLRLVSSGGSPRGAGTPLARGLPPAPRPVQGFRELPVDRTPPRRLAAREISPVPPTKRSPSLAPQPPKAAASVSPGPRPRSSPPPSGVPKPRKTPPPAKPTGPPAKLPAPSDGRALEHQPRSADRREASAASSAPGRDMRSPSAVEGKPPQGPGGSDGEVATVRGRLPLVEASSLRVLRQVPPAYPPGSRRRGEQGTVVLLLTVVQGRVRDVDVERSSGFGALDDAAAHALRKWRFDAPDEVRVRVPVAFRLEAE